MSESGPHNIGQHVDNARAQDNGQARPGSAGRRTAGSSAYVGQSSGGESQNGPVPAGRSNGDISTETKVR